MPYWEETRILIDRSFGIERGDEREEFERKIVESEYAHPGSLLAIALNPHEHVEIRGVASRIVVEMLGTSVCQLVRAGALEGLQAWTDGDTLTANYTREDLHLPASELDKLREIVEGSQWCLECQDEVECGPVSGLCPECGEETVPAIGRDFLKSLYERFKKARGQ